MSSEQQRSPLSVVGGIVSWLAIALVAAVVLAVVAIPRLIGAVPLTVLTGSMVPTYRPGDIVVVQPIPANELAIGDTVTFQPVSGDPTLNTHRIVHIENENGIVTSVTTRGDANNSDDPPIVPEQIQGRVIYSVPLVGHLTMPRNAILAGGVLIGGGLILYTANQIVGHIKLNRTETTEA